MIEWMGDLFGINAYAFDITSVYGPADYFTNVGKLFTDILKVLVSLAGVVAFVFIIISGLKFVTSSGDEKKLDSAKSTLTFSIIGITVVTMSFVIIRIVQAFLGSSVGVVDEGTSGSGPPPPPPSTAACGVGSASVIAGDNLGFGYGGFSAGQKIFIWDGGSNRVDLGTSLSGPQLVSFTIPLSTPPGSYGGFIENVPYSSVACGPVQVIPPAACPYDYNGDRVVDEADKDILLAHFGGNVATDPSLSIYDLNGDGAIDLSDALDLAAQFGSC